ncbi:tetratricopeptide repeat protein [Acinetobacter sp. P8-3-8]|uniref:tetratricopeptide repeat protein n=1 Tax=Acinetobacter sp. P8-3-8 TaxID=1029823 RepID=UPI00024859B4|nr:tetratricopeptide repeat protein [Acinetobacter sp. P8-3-8]
MITLSIKLNLALKPISKIVASAYLGKALHFLNKDDQQFQKYFDKAINLKTDFYQAYAEVAIQCALTGKQDYIEKSLNYFEMCFEINPKITDTNLIQAYAIVLTEMGAFKKDKKLILKAIEFYKNLLNVLQSDPNYLKNYANSYKKLALLSNNSKSLFSEAFKFYKKSLEINPNDIQILIDYGIAIFYSAQINKDLNLYNNALKQLEKAKELQPKNLNVLTNYITCLLGVANINEDVHIFEQAKDTCENVLNIDPNNLSNLENYAICLSALAELKNDITIAQKAIDHFERALKFKPNDKDLNHNYKEAISIRNSLNNNIATI